MIVTEIRMIGDREFTYTYSDKNMMIQRNGVHYSEAYDPVGTNRVYTETFIPIRVEEYESDSEDNQHK